jgi:hypothetical protein
MTKAGFQLFERKLGQSDLKRQQYLEVSEHRALGLVAD